VSRDHIVCREFVEVVTEYLEQALPAGDAEMVEEHLVMCDWCRDYLDQMETTAVAVASAEPTAPPEELVRSVMDAFRERHTSGGS
jgi:predicted anti-sigma-YlaC factor YlaD